MSYRSSVLYAFVRGRQLEGTYPGDRSTGIWPITDARIRRGWGSPPEEMWPESDEWPPSEPPNIDAAAKAYRIGRYQRVRTLLECKAVLAGLAPVLVSLEITDKWGTAPSGRIRALSPNESPCGWHSVLLVGYDDGKSEFTFQNCWGTAWGDQGFGYISYERFEASWCEGWLYDLTWSHMPLKPTTGLKGRAWGIAEHGGGEFHCREFVSAEDEESPGHSPSNVMRASKTKRCLFGPSSEGKVMARS